MFQLCKSRIWLWLLILVIIASLPRADAESLYGTAADPFEVGRVGLAREWIIQIPFDSDRYRLSQVDTARWMIIAQSEDGIVHAVRASGGDTAEAGGPLPGTLLWSTPLGLPKAALHSAGIDRDLVTINRDMDAFGIDSRTGSIFWKRRLPSPPSAGSLPVGDWVYVPLWDKTVYRLPVNPYRRPSNSNSEKDTDSKTSSSSKLSLDPVRIKSHGFIEQQPSRFGEGVLWCTDYGRLTVIEPAEEGWERHEFFLHDNPNGPVAVRDKVIFAATEKGELTRFEDATRGLRLTWRFLLETSLHPNMPRPQIMLHNETLLVSLGEEGIAAHNASNGERLWKTSLQGTFLACIGSHLWCYDIMNRITAIRLIDGQEDAWLCPGPFTIPVTNRSSERIILASPRGLLASLRPRVIGSEQSALQPSTSSSKTSNDTKEENPAESPQPSTEKPEAIKVEKPTPQGKDEPFNFFGK
ncbi:MAG: PQQ-binding-like beta-propeller repeat protein [Planctomycetaceae bacterium]|nr:PQQ-binding-like beta-propeller repeat protein [Planctomycetaceae bacterium]